MIAPGISSGFLALALLGFAGLWIAGARVPERTRTLCLAALCAVAALGHTGVVRWDPSGGVTLRTTPPHPNEFFHYWLGTKYFAELGYTGLYRAAVVADAEDAPDDFRPDGVVRDLDSYALKSRGEVAADPARAKAHFTPARWAAFKHDLALLRGTTRPEFWHTVGWYADHGYNGSPVDTALLGGLARLPGLDAASFVGLARFFDLYGFLLFGVLVAGVAGAPVGLGLLLFLFVNPLNDPLFVGGAYLRADYLLALGVAVFALRMRWLAVAGVGFALAGWLRIFPLVFPGLLLARDLLRPDRAMRLREHARLHGAFAVGSLLLIAATSAVDTPSGRNAWAAFASNLVHHSGTIGGNQIGLAVPLRYTPANDRRADPARPREAPAGWRAEAEKTLDARRPLQLGLAALLVGLGLWTAVRGRDAGLLAAGLLIVWAVLPLAHYYYATLSLLALASPRRGELLGLAAGFGVLAVTASPGLLAGREDLRFALLSAEIALLLAWLCATALRRTAPADAPA